MNTSEVELLPCPFCGSEAHIEDFPTNECFILCNNCDCEIGRFQNYDKEQAIKAWNTRKTPKPSQPLEPLDQDLLYKVQELISQDKRIFPHVPDYETVIGIISLCRKFGTRKLSVEEIKFKLQKSHWAELNIDQLAQAVHRAVYGENNV